MSKLLDLYGELRETQAELRQLEEVVRQHPQYESLAIDLFSLQKRQAQLERELETVTSEQQIDVVRYTLQPGSSDALSVRALASTLDRFQAAISITVDAVKNGTKKIGRLAPGIAELSRFDFAYSFDGSVGVVLTMPNDRLLIGESDLDQAVDLFFKAARAQSREEIVEYAKVAGIPAVRRLFEWSQAHTSNGVNADIQWRKKDKTKQRLAVEPTRLKVLEEMIEETSDSSTDPISVVGRLVGLDTALKSFHLQIADTEDVKGGWSETFLYSKEYPLNEVYRANLLRKTIVYYAYDREDVSWELVDIAPVSK